MSKLSKNILDKITKEQIKPVPKWHFVVMYMALWILILLAITLGSLAFGIIIKEITGTEWAYVGQISESMENGLGMISILPYLWMIVFVICIYIAEIIFSKTRNAYKIAPIWIVIVVLLILLVLLKII